MLSRLPKDLASILAFLLLAVQAIMPWTSLHFVTQDGPSHLYTAMVVRGLLLDANSPYRSVYEFQPKLVTNWSTTVLMNVAELLFGARDAEHAIATLCVVLGFFGLAYLLRSIDPESSPWSPVLNFLLFNWFLWIGFYNFYLGMALFPFVAGYFIRHAREMNARRAIVVGLGLVLLFFTHVLALAVALLCIGLAALRARQFGWSTVSILPSVVLLFIFIKASGQTANYDPQVLWALQSFPMHAFASSQGRSGEQSLLHPAMLFFMVIASLVMNRKEWQSSRADFVIAAVVCFGLYLLVPSSGFGGDEIKIRFAWTTFGLGCLVALSTSRLKPVRSAVAVYVACLLSITLWSTWKTNVLNPGGAVSEYSAALEQIPSGSAFIRVYFPAPAIRKRQGFDQVALEPLFHVDSLVAARRKLVALSDYQAITGLFPIAFKTVVPAPKQLLLWELEGSGPNIELSLRRVLEEFPVKIDYVVLLGDGTSSERASAYKATREHLDSTLQLAWTNPSNSFVRVYRR